ncbi:late competence development ComFB family protein [Candidatus Ventrimonas sp. KK005]
MAKKTNKTSHVMDLLTNGSSEESGDPVNDSAASTDAAAGQEKKGDIQSHTVTPKKVTVVDEGSQNDRLSQEILNKLSEELEQETQPKEPDSTSATESVGDSASSNRTMSPEEIAAAFASAAPAQEPEPAEAPASNRTMSPEEIAAAFASAAPAQEPESQAQTQADMQSAPQSAAPAPKAETPNKPVSSKQTLQSIIPKSKISETLGDDEYNFVNIMEHLILRQDITGFLNQYNVCTCRRCMSDVCALALTGLPSKYVVSSKDSLAPVLSYYESKYKIYMLTELIKACNKVRESPRHEKK